MQIRLKLVAVGLGLSVLAVLALSAASRSLPSDEALQARFLSHRADFARLVSMAGEDNQIDRIAPYAPGRENIVASEKNAGISEKRLTVYMQLFKSTGISQGLHKDINPNRIFFPIDSRGLVPTGYEKGLVYSQTPLSPVLKSLDKRPPDELWDGPDRSHVLVYKPIEDHWYIYYEQW